MSLQHSCTPQHSLMQRVHSLPADLHAQWSAVHACMDVSSSLHGCMVLTRPAAASHHPSVDSLAMQSQALILLLLQPVQQMAVP